MLRLLLIIALLVCSWNAEAQKKKPPAKKKKTPVKLKSEKPPSLTRLDVKNLPKGIYHTGKPTNAVRWTDRQGDNIVITTETGIYDAKKSMTEDGRSADLYAQHYLVKKGVAEPGWKIHDYIRDCPVDVQVNFIRNSFHVTDLDKDGTAEVWTMYKKACHGDMSPCDMRIIMYEGKQKYVVRGENKVKISEHETYGGEYKLDDAFAKGPKPFREHALELWKKNELEVWYNE
jgi:hypothetical protein